MMSPPQYCRCSPQGVVCLGIRQGLTCMELELQPLLECPTQPVTSQLSHAASVWQCMVSSKGMPNTGMWLQFGVPHGMSHRMANTSGLLSPQTLGSTLCPLSAFVHHPQ